MKMCSRCKTERPEADFYRMKSASDGLQPWCKPCMKLYYADRHRANYVATPRPASDPKFLEWKRRIKYTYNMSPERYQELLDSQGGVCAGCGVGPSTQRLSIDHDHSCCDGNRSCGRCVRGLLCNKCNRLVGLGSNCPQTLSNLATYLQNFAS